MEDGGHIKGFKISDRNVLEEISKKIESLGILLAGDGNHSLAAAKSFWETIKKTVPDNHPARYALVELVNIHDPGLTFEPIHRLVRGINPEKLLERFDAKIVESSLFIQVPIRKNNRNRPFNRVYYKNRRGSLY